MSYDQATAELLSENASLKARIAELEASAQVAADALVKVWLNSTSRGTHEPYCAISKSALSALAENGVTPTKTPER